MTNRPLFSSDRERHLWMLAFAAIGVVYATIFIPARLVGYMGEGLVVGAFIAGTLLFWAAVFTQGLKLRPGGLELGVAAGIFAVFILVFVRISLAERTHLIEYGVVGFLVYEALLERHSSGRRVAYPALTAIVVVFLIGGLDELLQAFVPARRFDPVDIGFNVLAAAMAVGSVRLLRYAREFRKEPSKEK